MFELVDVKRGGRESVCVINRLAKREVLYNGIVDCGKYCIVCDTSGVGANVVRGGSNYHLSCICEQIEY